VIDAEEKAREQIGICVYRASAAPAGVRTANVA
jgi:hypothetical protein